MAENSVSNPRFKPGPVHQFTHLLVKVLSNDGDWFLGTDFSGKTIFLIYVWIT